VFRRSWTNGRRSAWGPPQDFFVPNVRAATSLHLSAAIKPTALDQYVVAENGRHEYPADGEDSPLREVEIGQASLLKEGSYRPELLAFDSGVAGGHVPDATGIWHRSVGRWKSCR
jgi:hypothetical protein